MNRRSVLSLAVIGAFSLLLAATEKPAAQTGPSPGDVVFTSVPAANAAPIPTAKCTNAMLEAVIPQVKTADVYGKPDPHKLELVDELAAVRFTKANAQANNPKNGWHWVSSITVKDLNPESYSVTEHTDSQVAARSRMLAGSPIVAILKGTTRTLPSVVAGGDTYKGGDFVGTIVLARIDTDAPICAVPVAAHSSKEVSFRTRGIRGTTLERTLLEDFKTQMSASLKAAIAAAAPAFSLSLNY